MRKVILYIAMSLDGYQGKHSDARADAFSENIKSIRQ